MQGDQKVHADVTVASTRVAVETEKCRCSSYIPGVELLGSSDALGARVEEREGGRGWGPAFY